MRGIQKFSREGPYDIRGFLNAGNGYMVGGGWKRWLRQDDEVDNGNMNLNYMSRRPAFSWNNGPGIGHCVIGGHCIGTGGLSNWLDEVGAEKDLDIGHVSSTLFNRLSCWGFESLSMGVPSFGSISTSLQGITKLAPRSDH